MSECKHRVEGEMGYYDWHMNAERRVKQGKGKQKKCKVCKKYIWIDLWDEEEK